MRGEIWVWLGLFYFVLAIIPYLNGYWTIAVPIAWFISLMFRVMKWITDEFS